MTVLFAGLATMLTLLLGAFADDLAEVISLRARAQAAADAAALAAVLEAAPFGDSRPLEQAQRYSESNGARLVECSCPPGATSVQVRVSIGGVTADARAVLDPTLVRPAAVAGPDRLHPELASALARLVDASQGRVYLVSGYRSTEHQSALWQDALARYGSPEAADDWVARPGTSMHERGLAVDLGGDLELAASLVERLGLPLSRPLANEPWHFELIDPGSG